MHLGAYAICNSDLYRKHYSFFFIKKKLSLDINCTLTGPSDKVIRANASKYYLCVYFQYGPFVDMTVCLLIRARIQNPFNLID